MCSAAWPGGDRKRTPVTRDTTRGHGSFPRVGGVPLLLLWMTNLGAVGCGLAPNPEPPAMVDGGQGTQESGRPDQGVGRSSELFTRTLQRLVVEFKVHRFSAPEGTFTKNDGLWKVVAGAVADAATAMRLADNGFRAAVGQESDRAAISRWLESVEGVRSSLDVTTPDASRAVEIEVGPCPPRLTVFHYDRRGVLHGQDFSDAKARFRLSFEMRSPNLREVRLELIPEIEEPPGPPKWVITEEGARQVPVEQRHPFVELAFSATIPEHGFLLLGPASSMGARRSLAAQPFLIEELSTADGGVERRESIYIISPIVRVYTPAVR